MGGFIFHSTHQILKYLHKMIDAQVTIEGEENIDFHSPLLFCANHFTRLETFIMPNVFYQKLDMEVRSLADRSLFTGALGDFLSEMGTVSTNDPYRNEIVVRDLMTAKHNWIIYPEGSMIKNKKLNAVCLNILKDSSSFGSDTNRVEFITDNTTTTIAATNTQ